LLHFYYTCPFVRLATGSGKSSELLENKKCKSGAGGGESNPRRTCDNARWACAGPRMLLQARSLVLGFSLLPPPIHSNLPGTGDQISKECEGTEPNFLLTLPMSGCGPFKNCGSLADVSDAEKHQRRVRTRLQPTICVVYIDTRFP